MSVIVKGGGGGKSYDGNYLITPSTSDVIIPAKSLLTQDLVIQGDTDLVSSNIMSGKEIFGINGSAQGNSGTYAWKKQLEDITTEEYPVTINGSFINGRNYISITSDHAVSILTDEDFFNYFEVQAYTGTQDNWGVDVYNYIQLYENNGFTYGEININGHSGLGNGTWTWDSTKSQIILNQNIAFGLSSGTLTGSQTITKYNTINSLINIGYVVSDNSSAYPNNATHTDGYYYTQIS